MIRILIIFLIVLLGFLQTDAVAANEIEKIEYIFMQERLDEAIQLCRDYIDKNKGGADKAYLISANCLMRKKDYESCEKNFKAILEKFPESAVRDKAQLGIAEVFFLQSKFDEAKKSYEELISAYPESELLSICYYRLGNIAHKQGRWDEAKKLHEKVMRDYPLCFEAEKANDALINKQFYFTLQVGSFIDRENAVKLKNILKSKGFDADIIEADTGSGIFYRVRVGRFDKKEDVLSCQTRLKKEGFPAKIYP